MFHTRRCSREDEDSPQHWHSGGMAKRSRRLVPCGGTSKHTNKPCRNRVPQGADRCGKCKGRLRRSDTVTQVRIPDPNEVQEVWDEVLGRRVDPSEIEIDSDGTRITRYDPDNDRPIVTDAGLFTEDKSLELDGLGSDGSGTVELSITFGSRYDNADDTGTWNLSEHQARWLADELAARFGWDD